MKILFISPNSPFESIGGVERYIINLIDFYKHRVDCDIHLLLPTSGKSRTEKVGQVTYSSNS